MHLACNPAVSAKLLELDGATDAVDYAWRQLHGEPHPVPYEARGKTTLGCGQNGFRAQMTEQIRRSRGPIHQKKRDRNI